MGGGQGCFSTPYGTWDSLTTLNDLVPSLRGQQGEVRRLCLSPQQLPGGLPGGRHCHQAPRVGLEGGDSLVGVQAAILPVVQAHQVSHHHQSRFLGNRQHPDPRWGSGCDCPTSSHPPEATGPTLLLCCGPAAGLLTRTEGVMVPSDHPGQSKGKANTFAA